LKPLRNSSNFQPKNYIDFTFSSRYNTEDHFRDQGAFAVTFSCICMHRVLYRQCGSSELNAKELKLFEFLLISAKFREGGAAESSGRGIV